jgi:hypothetical protein
MKVSEEFFPSNYIKASDLNGKEITLTMANVEREKLGDDNKPVLYFKGAKKGLVLNKTNTNAIGDAYGDDSDDWFGQPIILFSAMVEYAGKLGPAIRVKVPPRAPVRREEPISSGPQRQVGGISDNLERLDDDIPF